MDNKIHAYRQPMVTTTGILLGFVLNFATSWITKGFKTNSLKEFIIGIGLCTCILLLMIVLYRILKIDDRKENADTYYKKTLLLLISGLSITFCSILLVMVINFFENRA
jgi:uncharacterized membrane protein YjfL (UPF0719 family)